MCTAEKKYHYKRRKRYEKRGSKGFFGRTGDGEDYYVLKGTATIDDNHERILTLKEGEHYFTPSEQEAEAHFRRADFPVPALCRMASFSSHGLAELAVYYFELCPYFHDEVLYVESS